MTPAGIVRSLTDKDWRTISIALNHAMDERDSFADAYSRKGPEAKAAQDMVKRFEKLHRKIFGVASHRQREMDRLRDSPKVSIYGCISKEPAA